MNCNCCQTCFSITFWMNTNLKSELGADYANIRIDCWTPTDAGQSKHALVRCSTRTMTFGLVSWSISRRRGSRSKIDGSDSAPSSSYALATLLIIDQNSVGTVADNLFILLKNIFVSSNTLTFSVMFVSFVSLRKYDWGPFIPFFKSLLNWDFQLRAERGFSIWKLPRWRTSC